MPSRQPVPDVQRLTSAVDRIVCQLNGSQLLQFHQVQRQVGDIVVRQIERLHVQWNLRQLSRRDSVLAQVESSYPLAQVVHLGQVVVGKIQLCDIPDVLQLGGDLLQLQPGQGQPFDGQTFIDAAQSGHAGARDAGVIALTAFGTDVRRRR